MEIFLTVITGFLTFSFGQIAVKLLIDPVQEFKRVVAEISHALLEYANIYGHPSFNDEEIELKVSKELRKLSSRLSAQMYLVPAYPKTAKLFGLPKPESVAMATAQLIALSNGFGPNQKLHGHVSVSNVYRAQLICDALGTYVYERRQFDPALLEEEGYIHDDWVPTLENTRRKNTPVP